MNWLLNYISEVQKRTPSEKKKFALWVSLLITGLIFAFWLSAKVIDKDRILNEVGKLELEAPEDLKALAEEGVEGIQSAKGIIESIRGFYGN